MSSRKHHGKGNAVPDAAKQTCFLMETGRNTRRHALRPQYVVTVQGNREGSDTTEILVREIRSRERRFSSGRAAFECMFRLRIDRAKLPRTSNGTDAPVHKLELLAWNH
jgi:hypothetical protein